MSDHEYVTCYQAAKILNAILVESGRDEVPTQLVYQYARKGYIRTYDVNDKTMVDLLGSYDNPNNSKGDFGPWMVKYLARKGVRYDTAGDLADERKDTSELQSSTRG